LSLSETMENIKSKITEAIDTLCEKYKDDPYMISKTENFICNQLPLVLQNIEKNHADRVQRIEDLTTEQDAFIQSFLTNNRYFYASSTENFFYYDGENYASITEDEVLYNILSSISRDRQLMSWKYKTKSAIMKRIKENHVYSCIPESATIQSVLNVLSPAIFSSKNEAKYFLTILGDNIMKKSESLIHMMDPAAKMMIGSLNSMCQIWFGANLNQSFKYKYHQDHLYNNIRLLSISGIIDKSWTQTSIGLNLLFVACHYSNRYSSSDIYVSKYSNDDTLIDKTFYLKNISPEILMSTFMKEYITVSPGGSSFSESSSAEITWKNMLYLWKHFLESKQLPNVVLTGKVKSFVSQQLEANYDETADIFKGVSSKYLPTVCQFLKFWEETMIPDETELEIEISELATLFKQWSHNLNITEKQVVNILKHFFPDLEIDQEKYIYKMRSKLWDKQVDIMMAMDDMKDKNGAQSVSTYDAYVYYCNYMNGNMNANDNVKRRSGSGTMVPIPLLVSKQYFDKYMG
jgi:hypothetical protein